MCKQSEYVFPIMLTGCPDPEGTEHGEVTWNGTEVESSVATYTCSEGYELTGPTTRKCRLYARWDQRIPNCKSK